MFPLELWSDDEDVAGFERKALSDVVVGIEVLHVFLIESAQ